MLRRRIIKQMHKSNESEEQKKVNKAIYALTKADMECNRISASHGVDDPEALRHTSITPRFGVKQTTAKGKEKTRAIDDFKKSGINATTSITELITHNHIGELVEQIRSWEAKGHQQCRLIKSDFKSAYRCLPIADQHRQYADIIFWDQETDQPRIATHTHYHSGQWHQSMGGKG